MKIKALLATTAIVLILPSCSTSQDNVKENETTWFKTTSPSGTNFECLWVGKYGGLAAASYQAEMLCWEVK